MWTPSYYQEWSSRRGEVIGLRTVADAVGYACRHRIGYVIATANRLRDLAVRQQVAPGIEHSNDLYSVLRVAALCPADGQRRQM